MKTLVLTWSLLASARGPHSKVPHKPSMADILSQGQDKMFWQSLEVPTDIWQAWTLPLTFMDICLTKFKREAFANPLLLLTS